MISQHLALRDMALFTGFSDTVISQLTEDSEIVNFKTGHTLFEQNNEADHFSILLKGVVKIVRNHFDRTTLLAIITEGEVFGALLMTEEPKKYPGDIIAVSSCSILKIPKSTYLKYWITNTSIQNRTQDCVQKRILTMQDDRSLQFFNVEKRIANFLLRHLALSPELHEGKLHFKITRKEIASAIGAKTESVIRAMSAFEKEGILETDNGMIQINKPDKLATYLE